MRDYRHLERYLNTLQGDIYAQPPDEGHTSRAQEVIERWISVLDGLTSILDVGCGQGFAMPMLAQHAERVEGVTLGADYQVCVEQGLSVRNADMSFLPYADDEFDLIFARHSLEHSPMPLLTLMEWRRVSRRWLILIVPSLSSFGFVGRNHYYVLLPDQWEALINTAGWTVVWTEDDATEFEHRYFCEVPEGGEVSDET